MIAAARQEGERPAWAQYLSYGAIGIEMGAALVVGMGLDWFLDRTFDTRPWCLVVFTAFGIVAGFRNVLRAARRAAAEGEKK